MVRAESLPQRGSRSGYAEHRPLNGARQRVSSSSLHATLQQWSLRLATSPTQVVVGR